jgi:prepilin-type processing-associated H-X9-DG protein
MDTADSKGTPPEANKDGQFGKALKHAHAVKGRLLFVLLVLSIALLAAAIWRATTTPSPSINRSLLWRIKQLLPWFRRPQGSRVVCGTNLAGLSGALRVYANDSDAKFPPPNKWCDLLVDLDFTTPQQFLCSDARRAGDRGPGHYAINPNATPYSDPNVVLLFETKAGWNQFGGPEILTIRRHDGMGKGSNIAFVDGKVKFINRKELSKLKWK